MCACERRRVIAQPRGARPRGPAVVARESQPGPPHLDGSRDDAGSRFKKVIRAPALQAVRLVWVPRTSRSATPKRPFVGNKNDVAFSVPDPVPVGSAPFSFSAFRPRCSSPLARWRPTQAAAAKVTALDAHRRYSTTKSHLGKAR